MGITSLNRISRTNTITQNTSAEKLSQLSGNAVIQRLARVAAIDVTISNYERITLIENLRDEINAGIEITKTIRNTAENSSNRRFTAILNSIAEEVENGHSLTDSINLFPNAFPEYLRAMIAAAEESGDWTSSTENGVEKPGILDLILTQLKRDEKIKSKIKSAMMYPSLILILIVAAMLLITFLVLPRMREFFTALDMEKNLNFASRSLLTMGDFIEAYYYSIPFVLAAIALGVMFFWKVIGRTLWQKHCFDAYILGKTLKKLVVAETFALLATLIRAGLPATHALKIIIKATTNPFVKNGLDYSYGKIQAGQNFSKSIKEAHHIFEKEPFQVLASAQETGNLDERPMTYAKNLFNKAEEEIDALIAVIPVVLLVFVGIIVGFIVIAFYGSFFGAIGQLSGH